LLPGILDGTLSRSQNRPARPDKPEAATVFDNIEFETRFWPGLSLVRPHRSRDDAGADRKVSQGFPI